MKKDPHESRFALAQTGASKGKRSDPYGYGEVNPLDAAITWLADNNVVPYFRSALHTLIPIPRKGLGTLVTDAYWRVYYDEAWMRTNPVHVNATVLVHELWHNLNRHGDRGKDMPKAILMNPTTGQMVSAWNVACDEAINWMMKEEMQPAFDERGQWRHGSPWEFPKGCVFPATFDHPDGLLEEDYMKRLLEDTPEMSAPRVGEMVKQMVKQDTKKDEQKQGGKQKQGGDDKGDGDEKGDSGSGGSSNSEEGDEGGDEGTSGGGTPGPMQGQCGSSVTGESAPWEDPAPDSDDDSIPEGVEPGDADVVIRQTAREVEEASKTRGTMPGSLKRWADRQLRSRIPWEQQLRSEAKRLLGASAGKTDYTFSRRNRRQGMVSPGLILPGMYHPDVNVAMVVDTSGSMSQAYLEQGVAEVERVARAAGAKGVTVLATDAAVHTVARIRVGEAYKRLNLVGGGGTDMRVGMRAAEELKPMPDVVVVFTDGYTPWPEEAPTPKTIIVLIGASAEVGLGGRTREGVPSWAKKVIAVETDREAAA